MKYLSNKKGFLGIDNNVNIKEKVAAMIIIFLLFILVCFLYFFYLVFFWNWAKSCQPFYTSQTPLLIGHRGSPVLITENTIPSFEKAIDLGADGLEFDIRLSKDNQIVVFHEAD